MQVLNALRTLWITLPLKGVTDEQGTLDAYGFALEPFSIEAIQNTVNSLRRGEIEDASKQWCPRPPELAAFVRTEQKRLDALNRKPAVSYVPMDRTVPFMSLDEMREIKEGELRHLGYDLIKAEVSIDTFVMGCNRKIWPVKAVWFWQLQAVWAPRGAAMPATGSAVLQPKQEKAA